MLTVVPDLIQPLVAYRMWGYSIDARGLHLGNMNGAGDAWLGAERRHWATASCARPRPEGHTVPTIRHSVPNEYCTCGFYSVKTLEDAEWILLTVRAGHRGVWMDTGMSSGGTPFPRHRFRTGGARREGHRARTRVSG